MKRLVLGIIVVSIFTSSIFAWNIVRTERHSAEELLHYVKCDNGRIISILENTSINKYYFDGSMYSNMSSAVNAGSSNAKLYYLKQEAMVCKSRSELRMLLSGDGTTYRMRKTNLKYGSTGDCFLANSDSKVKILKKYANETFNIEYDDGKKQWTETVKLCDTYYLVESERKKYYIRKSDIDW